MDFSRVPPLGTATTEGTKNELVGVGQNIDLGNKPFI